MSGDAHVVRGLCARRVSRREGARHVATLVRGRTGAICVFKVDQRSCARERAFAEPPKTTAQRAVQDGPPQVPPKQTSTSDSTSMTGSRVLRGRLSHSRGAIRCPRVGSLRRSSDRPEDRCEGLQLRVECVPTPGSLSFGLTECPFFSSFLYIWLM